MSYVAVIWAMVSSALQKHFAGHVSKSTLLIWLLPLSAASFFGTLSAAALFYPAGYNWRVHAISQLTSLSDNPQICWLPSLGIMLAMLLLLPFAGYVAQRLHGITPRLARSVGLAFPFGFVGFVGAMAAQLAQPVIGLEWLHEFLARVSAGCLIVGVFCCCGSAIKDWLSRSGDQGSLPGSLVIFWVSLSLLPAVCLASIGALVLLGQQAGLVWVEDLRYSFRPTVLWHLAFWEWAGTVMAYIFLIGSVLLLPASCREKIK